MSNKILSDLRKITFSEKLSESIESFKFVSHRAKISKKKMVQGIHIQQNWNEVLEYS